MPRNNAIFVHEEIFVDLVADLAREAEEVRRHGAGGSVTSLWKKVS